MSDEAKAAKAGSLTGKYPTFALLVAELAALDASIVEWQRKKRCRLPANVRLGAEHCPLCMHHAVREYLPSIVQDCGSCVIMQATRQGGCRGTPYGAAFNEWYYWNSAFTRGRTPPAKLAELAAAWRKAAQAEIDFLCSLRPRLQYDSLPPAA